MIAHIWVMPQCRAKAMRPYAPVQSPKPCNATAERSLDDHGGSGGDGQVFGDLVPVLLLRHGSAAKQEASW